MPISVDTNINKTSVTVIESDIVEIIAIINILADDRHHEYAMELSKKIYASLPNNSKEFLKDIYYMPFQGLEFYELVLDSRIFCDVDKLIQRILSYNDDNFIFVLTGEQISFEQIKIFKKDRKKFGVFLDEAPWVVKENIKVFERIMYDTESFKTSVVNLLKDVKDNVPKKVIHELTQEYKEAIDNVNYRLTKVSPIELMQEFMNKKIDVNSNITEYIFIPSYFIKPHYLMGFNNNSRLNVFDVRRIKGNVNKQSEQVTETLKIISDKTRLEILRLVLLQPTYGKVLADRLNLTTATVSHHLDLLLKQGLIKEQKSKNIKYFSADPDEIDNVLKQVREYLFNN